MSLVGWLASRTLLSASEETPPTSKNDSADAKKEPELKTSDIPPETYVVPANADARELLRFIHKIAALRPDFQSEADAEEFLDRLAKRDHRGGGSTPRKQTVRRTRSRGAQGQAAGLSILLVVGVKDAFPKALKFAEQLKEDHRPVLAELGQAAWVDFKMSTIPTRDAKDRRAVVDIVADTTARKPRDYYEFATNLGQMLEMLGDGDVAAAAYEKFGDILSKNLDENFRSVGEKMKTGAVRRARLLSGDPVKVSGKTLDGQPFDISQYKGKVVVVDFWATWCGPCRAELPNLKAVYEKYHGRGLEVVGVSLDDNKDDLVKFLKENHLPWKILVSTEPHPSGFDNPIADQYGISGIPTVFLMNRDGKVVSLAARGDSLAPWWMVSSMARWEPAAP